MKQYMAPAQLRIIGKGWEVRHQLNKLARAAGTAGRLTDYTAVRPPHVANLGGAAIALVRQSPLTQASQAADVIDQPPA